MSNKLVYYVRKLEPLKA